MMSADQIVSQIRKDLEQKGNAQGIRRVKRFFKEEIACYGVMTKQTREVVEKFYPFLKENFTLALEIGEKLFRSEAIEEKSVAIGILTKMSQWFTLELFEVFDSWVDYLDNWATTDAFSLNIIGKFVALDNAKTLNLLEWTKSENRWRRRTAAVSLIGSARKGLLLNEVLCVAEQLMLDKDEMVQKGVGWLLKETSEKHPKMVHSFLLKWRDKTAGLILRYASEKLTENMKVLKRDRNCLLRSI